MWTGCSVSRRASEVSGSRYQVSGFQEARDSLREEILQNLNENLEEHEVIRESVFCNDTVRLERVTDRTTVRGRTASAEVRKEQVRVIRDTIIVQRTDSVLVEKSEIAGDRGSVAAMRGNEGHRSSTLVSTLKWIFFIIMGLIALVITAKVCLRK